MRKASLPRAERVPETELGGTQRSSCASLGLPLRFSHALTECPKKTIGQVGRDEKAQQREESH